ncbi:thymidine kinase 2-like protein, partial [Dinothrombium tinctorium]
MKELEEFKRSIEFEANDCENKTIKIAIEGNRGSGKASFIEYVRLILPSFFVEIREAIWNESNNAIENLMKSYNQDSKRWSFAYQSFIYTANLKRNSQPSNKNILIENNSILTSHQCYTSLLKEGKFINEIESELLDIMYEELEKKMKYDLIIYIRTDPITCFERYIKKHGNSQ